LFFLRTTGQFLLGKAFVKQNWNVGFDESGQPVKSSALVPKPMGGPHVEPGTQGGTAGGSPRRLSIGRKRRVMARCALDPKTGNKKWDYKMVDYTEAGVLTTASDLLFSGGKEGNFFALDARNGALLWNVNLGGTVASGPVTYAAGNHQHVAACADSAMYVFGLPN
jgi:alcohol dehydrogenase (cytochrome c)